MSITFKQLYIPNKSRNKYGDYPQQSVFKTSSSNSGGSGGGGVGTTAYLTGWATSTADTGNI